jgi:15-cis-phytoene synthase
MRWTLSAFDESYRSRAVPAGSARYWSWLFAARPARGPLLGMYALVAEWRALTDPAIELGVAQMKLAWWREELMRLSHGAPLHPITRYVAALPGGAAADFTPLERCIEAAAAQVAGVPIERAAELAAHADALYGAPLLIAGLLSAAPTDRVALDSCLAALSVGEYLAKAILHYGREARAGRMVFAIDDLLAAGIDNDDLIADEPSPRLQTYLDSLRAQAAGHFAGAAQALAPADRPPLRHLSVLAALGGRHLARRVGADFRLADLYNAWTAARRAAAGA